MPQVLSKSKTHPIRRQSWMDYFLNLLNTDKLIVYLYVLLRQIAVDSFPSDNCFGGAVGIIVGAAIGIARGLAGTTLGVLTAVCILIGLGIGAHDSEDRSIVTIGIAVLVGAVANMVGGSTSVVVVSTLIVIGIAIFVFKEERFTAGISVGAFVSLCGLIPVIVSAGLHDEFVSETSFAASLGVAIGIFISAITHASNYSAVVGDCATFASFIICVATVITEIATYIAATLIVSIGFLIAIRFGDNANAAATGVSIATAGITAQVTVVGTTVGIDIAALSILASTVCVYLVATYVIVDAITGPAGAVASIGSAFIGAAGGIFLFAFFAGLVSEYIHGLFFVLVLVAVYCATLCGIAVGVALAVASRRAHAIVFVAAFSGTAGFVAGILFTYLLIPDYQFIMAYLIITIIKALQSSEDFDTNFLVASAVFTSYVHLFLSIPNLLKIILGICFIIALFGFLIKGVNSKLEIKWKKIKGQLTSVCSQTGKYTVIFKLHVLELYTT